MKMNLKIIFFFLYLISNIETKSVSIVLEEDTESPQCFHFEEMAIEENEEITYELENNNLAKTMFIQYKFIESIFIYESSIDESNIIFWRKKGEDNFMTSENFNADLKSNIDKYIIKIEVNKLEINDFNICFNIFKGKGNSFKTVSGNSLKVSSYKIINSGKFPFFLKDDISSFTAMRINKTYLKYYNISNIYICNTLNSEEKIELNINKFFKTEEYHYFFWNIENNKNQKMNDIFIEISLDIIKYEGQNNKFEIELVKNKEIHYEYKLNILYYDKNPKIYYIDLNKYVFDRDLDILCLTNIFNNDLFISDSYNIDNENSINMDKRFFVINKNFLENEKYKNSKALLFLIIDEKYKYNALNIIYNFVFAGSSHDIYQYNDEITKAQLFKNNKYVINSDKCFSFYLINYFTDSDDEYIIEHEPVIGKLNISFSNSINLANNIPEYFEKLDNYKVDVISNSVITGDYGIFKINCDKNQKVLSYINIYKKNEINDVIYFSNQKAFLFLQKDQLHSFTLDSKLLEEKFSFRVRIWKKDAGKFNIEIKYNNVIYNTLTEDNFLEFKHEKNENPIIYISIKLNSDNNNKDSNIVILELIKDINIDNNLIEIYKSNIYNTTIQENKIIFAEYNLKNSDKIKLTLKNEENDINNICVHTGYGIYPYLIKPECTKDELISLNKNELINLEYENPFNKKSIYNINSDNHFCVSLYTDKNIKFDYVYEKYSVFDMNQQYKNLDFNGREIIQLNNNKGYKMIYYQINLCDEFYNNIQIDISKLPVFNYYFETKNQEIIPHNIKSDIIKGMEIPIDNSNPNIVFTKDETINAKFKYSFSPMDNFEYNSEYSKKVNIEKIDNKLKIKFESPFTGNLLINIMFITSDFNKYKGICGAIDLLEELKKEDVIKYYSQKLIQKEIKVEESEDKSDIDIEIYSKDILGLNRKEVKIHIINTLKDINMDAFYDPVNYNINFSDHFSEIEKEQNRIKIFIIILSILMILFLSFIFYRNSRRTKLANNYDIENKKKKEIQLEEDDVNETNKLFN